MIREQKALAGIGAALTFAVAAALYTPISNHFEEAAAQREQARIEAQARAEAERQARLQAEAEERQRIADQLERMIANDNAYVGSEGYAIVDVTPRAQGQCNEDATISNSGWYDGDTGLLYQLEKGGQLFRACISHSDEAVTRARAVSLSQEDMLSRMLDNDANYLNRNGYSIISNGYEALGTCSDQGAKGVFNDNSGWNGPNTGIMYKVQDNKGTDYWACLSHNNNEQVSSAIASGIIDEAMLDRMIANDNDYLSNKGYQIVGEYEALGKCEDRGSRGVWNDNSGWKGPDTGIMYTIKKGSQGFWACVEHRDERIPRDGVTAAPK
jgi:hypothetical protein